MNLFLNQNFLIEKKKIFKFQKKLKIQFTFAIIPPRASCIKKIIIINVVNTVQYNTAQTTRH